MLTGLILCLVAFADLRKRRPVAGNLLLLAAALPLALPVYGWFEPARAIGIARIGFALAAVGGLLRHPSPCGATGLRAPASRFCPGR